MTNPAESYENYVVPALFRPWASRLVEAVKPGPGDRVLDVACGTGIVARTAAAVAGPGATIPGIDPSPGMLEVARSTSANEGLTIQWHEGKAESLPFPDQSFRLVFCQQGVQFFSDRQAGLNEMYRVLEGGGHCVVSVWQNIECHDFFQALDSTIKAQLGSTAVQIPFSLPDADSLVSLLTCAGFEDVSVDSVSMEARYPDPERFLFETVNGLRAVVPALQGSEQGTATLQAIRSEMSAPLREVTESESVVLAWHCNIVRARRPQAEAVISP